MATLTQRGKAWVLNWHDAHGQHRKTIGSTDTMSKREATALLKAKELELASGEALLSLGGRPVRLRDALTSYLLWRGATYPDSNRDVENTLRRLLHDEINKPLDALDVGWLARWLQQHRSTWRTSTLVARFTVLRTFLRWCDTHGMRVDKAVLAVPPPRNVESAPPRWYTADELARLYAVSGEYAAWWKLIANTGLRRQEALRLEWKDIKDESIYIVSESHSRTKSGRWRIVPLSPGAREALDALPKEHATVLPPQTLNALTWKFKYYSNKAGVGGSLHKLRHTFASHLAMQGKSLKVIQQLLGHSSVTTTEIYAHLSPEHLAGAVGGLTI